MLTWLASLLDGSLAADEQITLFPALAWKHGASWHLEVNGVVFEPERRPLIEAALRRALGLATDPLTEEQEAIFRARTRAFLVDNERGEKFSLTLGGRRHALRTSTANGHFGGTFSVELAALGLAAAPAGDLVLERLVGIGPKRQPVEMPLAVHCLASEGLSVVSDVDDTIKVTEVRDRRAVTLNTFTRPFVAVPGMAALYAPWVRTGAAFHYVTGSPWQLHGPLEEFVRTNGFPAGSWHMQEFRLKDRSALNVLQPPQDHKLNEIEALLRRAPGRRFMLVGDSGEKDPEIYGTISRTHPGRIAQILIRDVTGETAESPRYRTAFAAVKDGTWQIFREPGEVTSLPVAPASP